MPARVAKELDLLQCAYPRLKHDGGSWVLIPEYPLPAGWNRDHTDIAFQIPAGYPATPPYGIYVPVGIRFGTAPPSSYTEPAANQPPFPGTWAIFSWSPGDGEWQVPSTEVIGRASLLSFVRGFQVRFAEGA
jgi:hypothetical protein